MGIKIVIDSTVNVPKRMKEDFDIVPLSVCFGSEEYLDGVTIDTVRFYEMLIEADTIPTTSQPSPDSFFRVFKKAVDNGDKVIAITVASKLSGTYQSAKIAAMDFADGEVYVVDSKTVAIGAGILAMMARKMVHNGLSAEEIVKRLEEERERVVLVALLDTLEYLKKGGRISKTVAFAGGVLSIKPVISIDDGEIKMLGMARGSKKGNNFLVQEIEKSGGIDFSKPVYLGFTGLNDDLLRKYIADSRKIWDGNIDEFDIAHIGSTIGTHAGPGAVAVAFVRK